MISTLLLKIKEIQSNDIVNFNNNSALELMINSIFFNIFVLLALLAPAATALRNEPKRDAFFWGAVCLASVSSTLFALSRIFEFWQVDFTTAVRASVAAIMIVFAIASALNEFCWRLSPIICIYMCLLTILAVLLNNSPPYPLNIPLNAWIISHISLSLLTYALVTLASVSALAATLQERALKTKRRLFLTSLLPSLVDADALTKYYLLFGQIILGFGLITGATINWLNDKTFLNFDHKTIFTLSAFLTIGILLLIQHKNGLRGRRAARIILVAYLFLTLGYHGVKFVTDVLIA